MSRPTLRPLRVRRWLAGRFLRLRGWQVVGPPPALPRYVLVAAPHTSNWDLVYMLAAAWCFELRPHFLMKHTWFVGPLGWVFRRLGGIAVRRDRRHGTVEQLRSAFAAAEALVLAVPPEGTRGHARQWKSGFYHIARAARVPIVLGFLDYAGRRAGFGPVFEPTGDIAADMAPVRRFYSGVTARHPELSGPVRLAEEADPAAAR